MSALPARNMKYGVLVTREFAEYTEQHLPALVEELTRLGCMPHNIIVKDIPTVHGLLMGTEFFAEYTDVDAVIVLAENDNSPEYTAMLYGVTKLQISWNMPVLIGDCRVASEVADMVAMQNEMEAAAPEHISPDKKSIN